MEYQVLLSNMHCLIVHFKWFLQWFPIALLIKFTLLKRTSWDPHGQSPASVFVYPPPTPPNTVCPNNICALSRLSWVLEHSSSAVVRLISIYLSEQIRSFAIPSPPHNLTIWAPTVFQLWLIFSALTMRLPWEQWLAVLLTTVFPSPAMDFLQNEYSINTWIC